MRHIGDDERRARLARRHGIAPQHRHPDPVAATRAMTALHATEPATVALSLQARVEGFTVADLDRALYADRSLVRQLAMRRTLFVFPRELLPAALGSAAARVAAVEAKRLAKDTAASGLAEDGEAWVARATDAVLALLAGTPEGLGTTELRERVPEIAGTITVSPGTKWGGEIPVGPRVLTLLGARGDIVRSRNDGHWRVSRHRWAPMADWLGERPDRSGEDVGYATIVRRWLTTFGPGTESDLGWWLGATKAAVRRALADVEAVEVALDGGRRGWVLPDDVEPVADHEPWAALLPVLDPTTMGWKQREFYLDPADTPHLFDRNGNAGTTAWWRGRIVGCWVQDDDATVRVVLRRDPGADARAALDREAERLTTWLDGVRVTTVYSSPQMKSARPA